MPNWKKLITSGSTAILSNVTASSYTGSFTGSFSGTFTSASFASTASFVNTLNQRVLITGSAAIGTSSLGPFENTLTLGARDTTSEGGQIGFNAPGGTYTSASFIDLYQNRLRILKGTNTTSTGEVASWNMQTLQMGLAAYTSPSSFPGTVAAVLAVDSGGNVITITGGGGPTISSFTAPANTFGITAWTYTTATAGRARIEFYNFNAPSDVGGGAVDVIWDGSANAQAAGNLTVNINNGGAIGNWAATYGGGQVTLTVDNFDPVTTYNVTLATTVF
jgi:hypothetical protein